MSDKHYESLPKPHTTYANIIKSLLPIGDNPKASRDELPTATYYVDKLHIDQDNLKDYRKICGFTADGKVPVTYFAVLSQALQMNMMVKEPFPFAMLGLVHIANSVTQYRQIDERETVSMSVEFGNLKDHDKGQQFDFITTVSSGDDVIWEGSSTYLARSKSNKSGKRKPSEQTVNSKSLFKEGGTHAIFEVPEDIGRRYAFISGDFNLIHLHSLSARAFGFPKAIAHGMWSQAKCLSLIHNLPEAYRVDVAFKLPIFLPSEVEMIADPIKALTDEEHKQCNFALYNAKNDKPHLAGEIFPVTD